MAQEWVEFNGCECIRETELALLVRMDDGREIWVPRSQINDEESDVQLMGDTGTLVVTDNMRLACEKPAPCGDHVECPTCINKEDCEVKP